MGQKVHPRGFRIGVTEPWRSTWYASKKEFGHLIIEDFKIRKFIADNYRSAEIAEVRIERTRDSVVVHLASAKPGIVIGKKGTEIDALKAKLEDLTGRRMEVKIIEINQGNHNAQLVADKIAGQLSRRGGSFRRVLKRTMDEVMDSGVLGIKVQLSGRLGGAEMSRCEKASRGSIPLSTLQQHVDYGLSLAKTPQGVIGVKVWLDLGRYNEEITDGSNAKAGKASKGAKRSYKR